MITRIEFASADGRRTATLQRVDERHVPPLGVSWWLTLRRNGSAEHDSYCYTRRSVAEQAARLWAADEVRR